jgi:hypothetical protein
VLEIGRRVHAIALEHAVAFLQIAQGVRRDGDDAWSEDSGFMSTSTKAVSWRETRLGYAIGQQSEQASTRLQ